MSLIHFSMLSKWSWQACIHVACVCTLHVLQQTEPEAEPPAPQGTPAVPVTTVALPGEAGKNQPKRLHVSNIPFRFRDPDLRAMFGVSPVLFFLFITLSLSIVVSKLIVKLKYAKYIFLRVPLCVSIYQNSNFSLAEYFTFIDCCASEATIQQKTLKQ